MILKQLTKLIVFICLIFFKSVLALDDLELDELLSEQAKQSGITDKEQVEAFKKQVKSLLRTKEVLLFKSIDEPCKGDFEKFCASSISISNSIECIKDNRESVSQICEGALKKQFGNLPLKEEGLYKGVLLPRGSVLTFNNQGEVVRAIAAQNFQYKGNDYKKGQVMFHETGLHYAALLEDQFINGIKFSTKMGPFFHKNGSVENAVLAEDTNIDGIVFKELSNIRFHSNGQVSLGTLVSDTNIGGLTFAAERPIFFQQNRTIRGGYLKENTEIRGIYYKALTRLSFYSNRQVLEGTVANKTIIDGSTFEAGSSILLNQDGTIYKH